MKYEIVHSVLAFSKTNKSLRLNPINTSSIRQIPQWNTKIHRQKKSFFSVWFLIIVILNFKNIKHHVFSEYRYSIIQSCVSWKYEIVHYVVTYSEIRKSLRLKPLNDTSSLKEIPQWNIHAMCRQKNFQLTLWKM